MNRAVFWDRDGVINEVTVVDGKAYSPRILADFHIFDGIAPATQKTRLLNYKNIIVTNQPDITRGVMPLEVMLSMHEVIAQTLAIDEILYCDHDNHHDCECRKPKPGMLMAAAAKHDIDLANSYMIGDTIRDVEAGKAAGCTTILIRRHYNTSAQPHADICVDTIEEIFDHIS